jgi:hypothetical protein
MGIAELYRNNRTKEDGFTRCVEGIVGLHLCITTLRTFIAAASTHIALGFAFIVRYGTDISTVTITIARRTVVIVVSEMHMSLFYTDISSDQEPFLVA